MFLPPGKAVHLRRDVCRWHVAELFLSLRSINRGPRGILCTRGEKAHNVKKQIKTDAGMRPSCAT